jgi:DNA gyrase subunit A
MKVTEKTGEVVGAVSVEETDELMLMTSGGQSIRIRVADVREAGRNTQGVKLVTLRGDERLQDIARVIPEDDEEPAEEADSEPEEGGDEGPGEE